MLTKKRNTAIFFILVLIFSLIVGMIAYILNNIEHEKFKKSGGFSNLGLVQNLLTACFIIFIACVLYYLCRLIPQVRASNIFGGILLLTLLYLIMTLISMSGSVGPFNPFGGEYLLAFFLRLGVTFFIPHVYHFIAKKITT